MTKYPKRLVRKVLRGVEKIDLVMSQFRDAQRFSEVFPEFSNYRRLKKAHEQKLMPAYEAYIGGISSEDMAASMETAVFLFTLAFVKQPSQILDLGSGFSSFVFRLYAKEAGDGVAVFSVDDNQEWLSKTRSFLVACDLETTHLLDWRAFSQSKTGRFDLIFHDLGSMELRAETLPHVLDLSLPEGAIVLDDMHSEYYRPIALKIVEESGFSLYSARKYTLDRFGRFSEVAIQGDPRDKLETG